MRRSRVDSECSAVGLHGWIVAHKAWIARPVMEVLERPL